MEHRVEATGFKRSDFMFMQHVFAHEHENQLVGCKVTLMLIRGTEVLSCKKKTALLVGKQVADDDQGGAASTYADGNITE